MKQRTVATRRQAQLAAAGVSTAYGRSSRGNGSRRSSRGSSRRRAAFSGAGLTTTLTLALALTLSLLTMPGWLSDLQSAHAAGEAAAKESAARMFDLPALPRADFNRLALQHQVPLFWETDEQNPGQLDPAELVVLGFDPQEQPWVAGGKLTARFEQSYRKLVEARRQEAVRHELDQGLPTLVRTDFTGAADVDKKVVRHISRAAEIIDGLHMKQRGADVLSPRVAQQGQASQALFQRNQGPWCVAPRTENDPFCNALPGFPPRRWDTYPSDEQTTAICDELAALPNGQELLSPFVVVRKKGDEYVAVPYQEAYGEGMKKVAAELKAAAKALHGTGEEAFERYLLAAAKGFETNTWEQADEAWAAMSATNSRWYLRIAPDEVYWDLCQEKAGFHVSFARIDRRSLEWQEKLNPLRDEMEGSLAKLIGEPYAARSVSFQMPDFIEIILNAGDARSPLGATIGQSLPNWGKVAEEGRGRTVVMTNLYTDHDSRRIAREKARSLLTAETMEHYTDDPLPGLIDIILHEATHNLGPHSDYKFDGKGPGELFGGRLASTLEELKAQTGSLYYTELLRKRGVITDEMARQLYTHAMVWAFGHISRGMFTPSGNPKPYSQLAAVQIGRLMESGAMSWETVESPETGKPQGKFAIHFDKIPAEVEKLMQQVGRIKATGDVEAAKALIEPYVSGDKRPLVHMDEITERVLRFPKGSLVYSVDL